jgi:hypothetical protein
MSNKANLLQDLLKEIHSSSNQSYSDADDVSNLFSEGKEIELDNVQDLYIPNTIDNAESLLVDDTMSRKLDRGLIGNPNDPFVNEKYNLDTYLQVEDYVYNLKNGKQDNDLDEINTKNVLDPSLDLTTSGIVSTPVNIIPEIQRKKRSIFTDFYG